jgi:DNA-binding NarL/FixJ family response regulator
MRVSAIPKPASNLGISSISPPSTANLHPLPSFGGHLAQREDREPPLKPGAKILVLGSRTLMGESYAALFGTIDGVSAARYCPIDGPRAINGFSPDVVAIELSASLASPLARLKELQKALPRARVLVLMDRSEAYLIERLMENGVHAVCLTCATPPDLAAAIAHLVANKRYLCPFARRAIGELNRKPGDQESSKNAPKRLETVRLSDRELEIFGLIGKAMSTRQIADHLGLSRKTIEAHKENIKNKLNLHSAAELARSAALGSSDNAPASSPQS